jgi:hypothetical protein
MHCEYIIGEKITLSTVLDTTDDQKFRDQLRAALEEAREPEQIVYIWRTKKDIPRLKGGSPIVYIGKAEGSLYDRYISEINYEATNYWARYLHIMSNFGPISFDIYETKDPELTENNFLFQYQQEFFDRPPINMRPYRTSLLSEEQKNHRLDASYQVST